MLQIELTNYCNFNCYFCDSRLNVSRDIMLFEDFKKIIDEANLINIKKIFLTPSDGEIFTIPDIIQYINYVFDNNMQLEFITNFTIISKKQIKILKTLQKKNDLKIFISNYGDGVLDVFKYMTQSNTSSFNKLQNNLKYAKEIGLNVTIEYRGKGYEYDFDNEDDLSIDDKYQFSHYRKITNVSMCSNIFVPRIMFDGSFCICRCSGNLKSSIESNRIIGNIFETSLSEQYYNIKRLKLYKNFKEESKIYCQGYTSQKYDEINFNILKHYGKISSKNFGDSNEKI